MMLVTKATEICRLILIYVKAYFNSVRLLVYYISVNLPDCKDMEHTMDHDSFRHSVYLWHQMSFATSIIVISSHVTYDL
jgi:hypothetical protein